MAQNNDREIWNRESCFKDAHCHVCGKKGHIAPVCKSAHCHACDKKGHIALVCKSAPCHACGKKGHIALVCKSAHCHACGKKGHIAPVCKSAHTRKSSMQVHKKPGQQKSKWEYKVHDVGRHFNDPVYVKMLIKGKRLSMKLDTGVEVSIISEETRKEKFPEEELWPSDVKLKTYTNQPMKITGTLEV